MCGSRYLSRGPITAIPRPRWLLLYGIVFLGLAALAIPDVAAAEVVRPALDGVVGGAVLVAIAFWIRGNRAALDQQDWCECAADTVTVRVIPSHRPEPDGSLLPHRPSRTSARTRSF